MPEYGKVSILFVFRSTTRVFVSEIIEKVQ